MLPCYPTPKSFERSGVPSAESYPRSSWEMTPRAWDRSPRAGDRSGCRVARPFFCPPRPQRGPPDVDGPLGGAILIPRPLGVVGYSNAT